MTKTTSTKPARHISYDDGVVCPAFNEGSWKDPVIQLRERVIFYQMGAKILDADNNVIASMTLNEAVKSSQTHPTE